MWTRCPSTIISIHALLAESDYLNKDLAQSEQKFLSTLSLRRATTRSTGCRGRPHHFYPRSPCGERQIHGPNCAHTYTFLSTLSLRRATVHELGRQARVLISIHALLAESDKAVIMSALTILYFYPRSPCGERPVTAYCAYLPMTFLSTLSLRRATHYGWSWYDDFTISIHALLAESDHGPQVARRHDRISIHALLAESDGLLASYRYGCCSISIHALLAESDAGP